MQNTMSHSRECVQKHEFNKTINITRKFVAVHFSNKSLRQDLVPHTVVVLGLRTFGWHNFEQNSMTTEPSIMPA